jgi:CBS domain containing-hemolysin-like protein
MEFGWISGPLVVLLIVLVNAFFVGSEMAMVASRRNRLEQLRAEGNANAAAALRITDRLDKYIAACQFGITLTSLGLGWVGEPAIAHLLESAFDPGSALAGYVPTHALAMVAAFSVITAMHIVLGELVPKSLSLQRAETMSMLYARPLTAFAIVFGWPVAALTWVGNAVLRLGGLEPASGHEMVHSVAELRLLVTGSQRAGVVEESEARIVARAFTFADITAGVVMTPRTSVESVPLDATRDEVVARLVASGRRRLPVYEGTLDRVVGIVNARDILADLAESSTRPFDLRAFMRPVAAVPESKGIDELLDELRTAGDKIAIVLDEYGGTAGLVTLSDLVEPLVGRIHDDLAPLPSANARHGGGPGGEHSGGEGTLVTTLPPAAHPDDSHSSLPTITDGMTRLAEWEEGTGTALTDDDREAADTLGGLVMARLGRIPELGDAVEIGGHIVTVEALDGRRVHRVRLRRKCFRSRGQA